MKNRKGSKKSALLNFILIVVIAGLVRLFLYFLNDGTRMDGVKAILLFLIALLLLITTAMLLAA